MKKKTFLQTGTLAVLALLLSVACSGPETVGTRTQALDDSLWNDSEWISAADAEVVTGRISGSNWRAADGASWFVSAVGNENKV